MNKGQFMVLLIVAESKAYNIRKSSEKDTHELG